MKFSKTDQAFRADPAQQPSSIHMQNNAKNQGTNSYWEHCILSIHCPTCSKWIAILWTDSGQITNPTFRFIWRLFKKKKRRKMFPGGLQIHSWISESSSNPIMHRDREARGDTRDHCSHPSAPKPSYLRDRLAGDSSEGQGPSGMGVSCAAQAALCLAAAAQPPHKHRKARSGGTPSWVSLWCPNTQNSDC